MKLENELGIIAQNYTELQSIHILQESRERYPLLKASPESTARAIFQAAEITILNLVDLTKRASIDIKFGMMNSAMVKISWALGFHKLLSCISTFPHKLPNVFEEDSVQSTLCIYKSPAFSEYINTLKEFDRNVLHQIEIGNLQIESCLANQTLDSPELRLLHLTRICNHEATLWERNLGAVSIPTQIPSYEVFIAADDIRRAVYDIVLKGDTFFTQFRGLHQVPEILSEEVNDHIEAAIRSIRSNSLPQAVELLSLANLLCEGIFAALLPMVDNLVTSDYHQIRENLGLTSGSHSVSLRYHMFKELYEQLWKALSIQITDFPSQEDRESALKEAIHQLNRTRFQDSRSWVVYLLLNECLKLRTFIFQWRDTHIHLPRNELGGNSVRSLTGSPDAIVKAQQMKDSAWHKDPMKTLAEVRGISKQLEDTPLSIYFKSASSLDSQILIATGKITQSRFKQVQERTGIFAERCPFSPPPPRKV
ncbi:hypothetical protein A6770_02185 [Nostoc minutum NIES-26]|uniref:Uncharacterized protein n=1 Tax=Nostoc minutum NIES-26 TaxID=1844469 RepID=A0A367QTE0_9NOSO|nr:hypothetical protein A6770_02185 [Nostoc minutum NIES-26]